MTYEDIVFDYNNRALDDRTWDMISDRERVEFVLRVRGMQEPVCYQALFDAIAAATSVAYAPGINISIEAFTAKIGPLYTAPQPCQECEKLKAERDELAAQVEKMRAEVELIKGGAENWKGGWSGTIQACDRALALPDLSTSILNRVRAETLRKAAELVIDLGDDSSTLDARTLTIVAHSIRALAADMEAGKCQVY